MFALYATMITIALLHQQKKVAVETTLIVDEFGMKNLYGSYVAYANASGQISSAKPTHKFRTSVMIAKPFGMQPFQVFSSDIYHQFCSKWLFGPTVIMLTRRRGRFVWKARVFFNTIYIYTIVFVYFRLLQNHEPSADPDWKKVSYWRFPLP